MPLSDMIGVYALAGLAEFGDQYLRHKLGEQFLLDLRVRIYDYLQRLSLSFFERTSTGELMSRVTNDVNELERFITHGVTLMSVDLLRLVGASAILLVLDWRLALVVLLLIPLIGLALRRFNQRVRPIYRQVRDRLGNMNTRLQDDLTGMRVIQAFAQEEAELERFRQVATVLQDTFLFNASVRENLLYGKPDATEQEIVAAARAAYAHEFIQQLPQGYDTEIGERGVKLSGGQRQRLALARAILADPRILILDKATSSVDAEAEYLIQQALEEVMKGRTSLVIAHRLSTIRTADKIIALHDGRIREVGSHRELLALGGLYSQLYQRQLELAGTTD